MIYKHTISLFSTIYYLNINIIIKKGTIFAVELYINRYD